MTDYIKNLKRKKFARRRNLRRRRGFVESVEGGFLSTVKQGGRVISSQFFKIEDGPASNQETRIDDAYCRATAYLKGHGVSKNKYENQRLHRRYRDARRVRKSGRR